MENTPAINQIASFIGSLPVSDYPELIEAIKKEVKVNHPKELDEVNEMILKVLKLGI